MTSKPVTARVVILENGPYRVTGHVPLAKQTIGTDREGGSETWIEGKAFPTKERYALCRCGQSKTKPFCDDTHTKVGFDGAETADRRRYREQANVTDGPTMQLSDAESLCAFARFCDPNGQVWSQVAQRRTARLRERHSSARWAIARPGAWWRGTKRRGTPSSPDFQCRLASLKTPRNSAVARCGCAVGFPCSAQTALSTKSAIASRFADAANQRTSRFATEHTRR